jgi:hypothetical protein
LPTDFYEKKHLTFVKETTDYDLPTDYYEYEHLTFVKETTVYVKQQFMSCLQINKKVNI